MFIPIWLFSSVNVHVGEQHRVLRELLSTLFTRELQDVNVLLVLVPDAVRRELQGTVAARVVLLAIFGMLLEPVFLEAVQVSGRLILLRAVRMHTVEPASPLFVLEVNLRPRTQLPFGGQRLVFVPFCLWAVIRVGNAFLKHLVQFRSSFPIF